MGSALAKNSFDNKTGSPPAYLSVVSGSDSLSARELSDHIEGSAQNSRTSQERIYKAFYAYAMAICLRYAGSKDDAMEILNDGFLKIFRIIDRYQPAYADVISSFKAWLRKIMVYTAIDHFRKNQKHRFVADLDDVHEQVGDETANALDRISYEEIIGSVQKLTPGCRAVFNLFIVEGFTHEEVSDRLGISVGASKSNLSKARKQLQKILMQQKSAEDRNSYR